jgi:hypothetical protein
MKQVTGNTIMGASGADHAAGTVPDPGATAGTNKFLREDASFAALTAANIPSPLTSNTSGTAANVTGTVAIANGGTGVTGAPAALTALGAAPIASPTFIGVAKSPEFQVTDATQGIVIPDTTNGNTYRLQIVSGVITLTIV